MRSIVVLIAGLVVIAAGSALALFPSTMNCQGRLTDEADNPLADGTYTVVFALYDAPAGGTSLWTEAQSVPTTDGLFSVQLGTTNPLSNELFADAVRYLGFQVDEGSEMTPRLPVTSVPFSFRTGSIDSAQGGTVKGDLNVLTDGGGWGGLRGHYGEGTGLELYDEQYELHSLWQPDADGHGGFLWVRNGFGGDALQVDGSVDGSGDPRVRMSGTGATIEFDLGQSGDSAVLLPDNAISAPEILNEPGIATTVDNTSIPLGAYMQDLTTVTITIPAAGYIVLSGQVNEIDLSGTTASSFAVVQIDEIAGGEAAFPYCVVVGASVFPSTAAHAFFAHAERVYFKPAGTFTFRLEALMAGSMTGDATAFAPMLTAFYYPTSYAPVRVVVSADEAAAFESAAPIRPPAVLSASGGEMSGGYLVDLRELELREAQERAQLAETRRRLAEARLKEQLENQTAPIPVRPDRQ